MTEMGWASRRDRTAAARSELDYAPSAGLELPRTPTTASSTISRRAIEDARVPARRDNGRESPTAMPR